MANPLLINGHKFDIGVYVVITSLRPLRIYALNGSINLHFLQNAASCCWEDELSHYRQMSLVFRDILYLSIFLESA